MFFVKIIDFFGWKWDAIKSVFSSAILPTLALGIIFYNIYNGGEHRIDAIAKFIRNKSYSFALLFFIEARIEGAHVFLLYHLQPLMVLFRQVNLLLLIRDPSTNQLTLIYIA